MQNDEVIIAPESVETPEFSEMSLADYRAQREGHAAPLVEENEEAPVEPSSEDEPDAPESTESEEEEKPADEKPAKKKGGFQRKLEQKDREIEALKARLAEPPAAKPAPPPPLPTFDAPKPKLEDFDSIETFTEALSDWKADERDFKREQGKQVERQQNERKQVLDRWNSGQAESKKAHADYDQALESVSDVQLSAAHQTILLESEHGAELAYALAKDRKRLEAFAAMNPLAAAREIGKLESAIASPKTPNKETKTATTAPRPIRPVNGGKAAGAGNVDVSTLSLAEFRKAREQGRIR